MEDGDLKVRVQIYGPVSQSARNVWTWVTIDEFVPESLDVDYLERRAKETINKSPHKYPINAVRFEVVRNGKRDMKITLTDVW